MRIIILIALFLISQKAFSQLHDATWILGYESTSPSEDFGVTQLSFTSGSVQVTRNEDWYGAFQSNNTVYSDSDGQYLSLFNAFRICGKDFQTMKNGDSIKYANEPNVLDYAGDFPQGGLYLPYPGHPDSLYLFYSSIGLVYIESVLNLTSLHLQYALIRLPGNNGLGEVVQRRAVVLQDTIQYGKLLAVKHANGRDWWLPINEMGSNRYYMYLIDPTGIHLHGQQTVGSPVFDGLGQAVFSPDGNYFAVVNCVTWDDPGSFLDVYKFDRCTGLFSEHRHMGYLGSPSAGVAISPNSRYLYVNYNIKLFQYDLFSPDLKASEVLIGTYVPPPMGELPATFYEMQLAPDNKIYICATNSVKYLHIIHKPDEQGLDCQFQRIGLNLPAYNETSVTYSPNYRLGPIDGSFCDTLGLDNLPVAWWRWEQDTLDNLSASFTDLSYYEPMTWLWEFGDGNTSIERFPSHTFTAAGDYYVCLTASNTNGNNTLCRTLKMGSTLTNNPEIQQRVLVSPNPFRERLSIAVSTPLRNPVFKLYDQMGKTIHLEQIAYGLTEVQVSSLPAGMYFWEVTAAGEFVKSGKVVKTEN